MKSRDLIRILKDDGWVLDRINGSHHIFVKPGHSRAISVPVHQGKDVRPGTARQILKDAKIKGDPG